MTKMSVTSSEPTVGALEPGGSGRPGRLIPSLGITNLSTYLVFGAVPSVLLALQVAKLDENAKAGNLAIVTGVGALVAMVMQPIWGVISDRTRSRFGRRSPFIVAGAILSGIGLIGLGTADSLIGILAGWVVVQAFINMLLSPLHAVLPDRLPKRYFGVASSIVGLGLMLGALGGQILAARLAPDLSRAYLVLAGILVIVAVLFVLFNRDQSSKDDARSPFRLRDFLSTFWVNPVQHPDFFWTFTARIVLFLGYYGVTNYQLYILTDYIGLGDGAVKLIPVLGLVGLVPTIIATLVSGPLSDRLGRRKLFVIVSSLILGVGMAIPFFSPTVGGMIAMAAVNGLGFGCYLAVDLALFTEVLPSRAQAGKDLGIANIASTVPQVIAPAFAGTLVSITGSYQTLFIAAFVLAVAGAAAILKVRTVR